MAGRSVWAEIDLRAIRHNVAVIAAHVAPAELCVVVKASAYGHGPVEVSTAAMEAGASRLAVAFIEEGAVLRAAGIEAPILLLSEPPAEAMADVVSLRLTPTLYTHQGVEAAAKAVVSAATAPAGETEPRWLPVHVKVDTGMHRVGAPPERAVEVAKAVHERPELRLEGIWTHFAVADDPEQSSFTAGQAARLRAVVDTLAAAGVRPRLVHACNSAGAVSQPACHYDMVRSGIAVYGIPPSPALKSAIDLKPAMSLRARVSHVAELPAGEALSYGLRYRLERPAVIATVPLGYADGVPWGLALAGGQVLVGGRRRAIAGNVTMDQIMIDCAEGGVAPGDEVVLIGYQGSERIDAWEYAGWAGTIAYEVVCRMGPRVPRVYI